MFYRLLIVITLTLLTVVGCNSSESGSRTQERAQTSVASDTHKADHNKATRSDGATTADVTKSCQLNVGWDPWEPYQYQERDGTVTGLDIDLFVEAAKRAGCTVRFQQGDWGTLLSALKAGQVDVLLGASITPLRKQYAYFSEPYRAETWVLYVRSEDVDQYSGKSLKKLLDSGLRIALVNGYVYGDTINAFQEDPAYERQFKGYGLAEETFNALMNRDVDGVLEDPFVGADVLRRKGWRKEIVRLPMVLHSGSVYVMFSQASVAPETVERINDAFAAMRADGTYRRILRSYGS